MKYEITIRLISFVLIFIFIALWEIHAPRRKLTTSKNSMAMFNDGNNKLPESVDRKLRPFLVIPDMHRVYHSVIIRESNSNYGFNLSFWDRLFGTYMVQPFKGHEEVVISLSQFRDYRRLTLPWLLILPFTGDLGKHPINRLTFDPYSRTF